MRTPLSLIFPWLLRQLQQQIKTLGTIRAERQQLLAKLNQNQPNL